MIHPSERRDLWSTQKKRDPINLLEDDAREARLVVLEIRGFSCKLDKDSSLHPTFPPLNKDVSGQKTIIYRFPRRL